MAASTRHTHAEALAFPTALHNTFLSQVARSDAFCIMQRVHPLAMSTDLSGLNAHHELFLLWLHQARPFRGGIVAFSPHLDRDFSPSLNGRCCNSPGLEATTKGLLWLGLSRNAEAKQEAWDAQPEADAKANRKPS